MQQGFKSSGFTLIELLIVMGLIAVLASLSFVNFIRPQTSASLSGSAQTLIADIKSQQLKSMAGDSISSSSAEPHGLLIESSRYTLFKGISYNSTDADNFIVPAESGITFSTSLPSSMIIFTKATGEVNSYSNSANTITITNSQSGESKIITFNALGAITSN